LADENAAKQKLIDDANRQRIAAENAAKQKLIDDANRQRIAAENAAKQKVIDDANRQRIAAENAAKQKVIDDARVQAEAEENERIRIAAIPPVVILPPGPIVPAVVDADGDGDDDEDIDWNFADFFDEDNPLPYIPLYAPGNDFMEVEIDNPQPRPPTTFPAANEGPRGRCDPGNRFPQFCTIVLREGERTDYLSERGFCSVMGVMREKTPNVVSNLCTLKNTGLTYLSIEFIDQGLNTFKIAENPGTLPAFVKLDFVCTFSS